MGFPFKYKPGIFIHKKRPSATKANGLQFVGMTGFEPATPCTPCKCATGLRHIPNKNNKYTAK